MLNKIDKDRFVSGYFAGIKRFNVKKLLADPKGEIGSYKAGYALGMGTKIALALAGYEVAF